MSSAHIHTHNVLEYHGKWNCNILQKFNNCARHARSQDHRYFPDQHQTTLARSVPVNKKHNSLIWGTRLEYVCGVLGELPILKTSLTSAHPNVLTACSSGPQSGRRPTCEPNLLASAEQHMYVCNTRIKHAMYKHAVQTFLRKSQCMVIAYILIDEVTTVPCLLCCQSCVLGKTLPNSTLLTNNTLVSTMRVVLDY